MRPTALAWLLPVVTVIGLTPPLLVRTEWGSAHADELSCTGDCNQDGQVTISELVLLVNIAVGAAPPSRCAALIEPPGIDYLVGAVARALGGCPTPGDAPPPVPGDTTLLNEILFDPADGQAQSVELKIGSGGSTTGKLSLRNAAGEEYALPAALPQPPPGGLLLIVFDGQGRVVDGVVHAGSNTFLDRQSGSVALIDEDGAQLDGTAWGADRFDSVPLGGGGVVGVLVPGMALARRPQSTAANQPQDWTLVAPARATLGAPNHNPGVGQLHPQDSAVMEAGEIPLSWFPAPGAVGYRVQLAADSTFSMLLTDEVVDRPPRTATLAPGRYWWRVQALAGDGSAAEFSYTSELQVVADLEEFAAELVPPGTTRGAQSAAVFRLELTHRLPVYAQRKDTPLLLLESDDPTGTRQAWNAPHPGTDEMDPADNSNCTLASTSMVNGFFADAGNEQPNLHQDRIGLELYTKHLVLWNGPVWDLNYGKGVPYEHWKRLLEYALGAAVEMRLIGLQAATKHLKEGVYDPAFREQFWNELIASLARDRPVPLGVWTGAGPNEHAMVARGVLQSGSLRYVWLNDPWHGRSYLQRLERLQVVAYYILPDAVQPVSDEADLRSAVDSDRDGIIDFDEAERFGTDKNNGDSDRDCIGDLAEVERSVFDDQHGWGRYWGRALRKVSPGSDGAARGDPRAWAPGPPPDSRQPELSADSDGGGLPDFVEDLDHNDIVERQRGESDPFDPSDDARTITGRLARIRDRDDPPSHFVRTSTFEHHLETMPDGRVTGRVHLTFNAMSTLDVAAAPPQCPQPRVITTMWDEVTADLLVDGRWTCNPDPNHPGPNLILTEREPVTHVHQLVTIMDPCLGTTRGDSGDSYTPYVGFALTGRAEEFSPAAGRLQWSFATSPDGLGDHAEWDISMTPR